MAKASDRARDAAPLGKKLDELYGLIEGIEIAMFTTRRSDGHLVSRPMATQTQAEGSDLWFVTDVESHKLDELEADPHVNLAYYKDRTREWVSVSAQPRSACIARRERAWEQCRFPDLDGLPVFPAGKTIRRRSTRIPAIQFLPSSTVTISKQIKARYEKSPRLMRI